MSLSPPPTLRAVTLDTVPLGLLSNPRVTTAGRACHSWVRGLVAAGVSVFIPEITDYEVRRELFQARLTDSLNSLDGLARTLNYLPLNTAMMRHAAQLWAQMRQAGRPTADPHALDGDVILAAQTLSLGLTPAEVVVATTNVGHLAQFVTAKLWQDIP